MLGCNRVSSSIETRRRRFWWIRKGAIILTKKNDFLFKNNTQFERFRASRRSKKLFSWPSAADAALGSLFGTHSRIILEFQYWSFRIIDSFRSITVRGSSFWTACIYLPSFVQFIIDEGSFKVFICRALREFWPKWSSNSRSWCRSHFCACHACRCNHTSPGCWFVPSRMLQEQPPT